MSIKKNLIYNVILNITNVLYPFITVPYVSRVLGAEGIGITSFATTFSGYFAILAALGIPTYGMREISKVRDDEIQTEDLFSELFSINVLSSLFFSIIYLVVVSTIPQLKNERTLFFISGITLYLSPFTIDWFFSGRENFKIITIRSLIVKFICVIGLFIFVRIKTDLIAYVLLNVFAILGNQFWNFFVLLRSGMRIKFTFHNLKTHIKPLLYLYASVIAISIYTMLDTLMLGFLSNYREVGYYTSATKISRLILPIVTGLGTVLLPRLSYYKEQDKFTEILALLKQSFSLMLFLALPITIALILISPQFVPLFFGHDFNGAIYPMQILSLLTIIIGINNLSGVQILIGLGYDKLFMNSVLLGVIVDFSLNLLLIPRYGAIGACYSSITAELLITFVTIYYAVQNAKIHFFSSKIFIKNLLAACVLIPIYLLLMHIHLSNVIQLIVFTTFGSIFYLILQFYFVKNETFFRAIEILKQKIK